MENIENKNFIHQIIDEELAEGGRCEGKRVHTRFPPEPNGFLHIGHAKAIVIDFGTAEKYGGICNLRMDDTNPLKEDTLYVEKIKEDIHWLGYDWEDRFYFASDYFQEMYDLAKLLIQKGKAFVCDLTSEEIREYRGSLTSPGKESPYRNRSVEENLDLFERMKAGEFPDGSRTLRAKIDMASGNMNMRDPVLYRIAHEHHHRTKDEWCIYPMYDYAHPLEDAIEGITHSLCSLEFEDHRPLYNWVVENTEVKHQPRQIEFARLNISNTIMSKRKLRALIEEGLIESWDDPRLPTISGLRRRGYTPSSIRNFCEKIGVSKVESMIDSRFLDYCLREDLNDTAPRALAVIDPVKLVITNFPENEKVSCTISNHPKNPDMGSHTVPFSKEIWIDRDDFMIDPPRKYFRMFVGNEVRLMNAFVVKCTGYDLDQDGKVSCIYGEYDPDSYGGKTADGRKIKGTIHWLPVDGSYPCEFRLYDFLFTVENPDADERDYHELINPKSLEVMHGYVEPYIFEGLDQEIRYQFMRKGYFFQDSEHSSKEHLVFNRIVTLKDGYKVK